MEKNYYKMNEEEVKAINEAMEVTCYQCEMFGNFIQTNELMSLLYELLYEYKVQKEKFEDFKKDVKENYEIKIFGADPYDEFGVSEKEFH